MNDNEKWPRTSPGFNTTREAYEHQAATVDRIIEHNTTDRNEVANHEKLIEEAAKAIAREWRNVRSHEDMARAALAVFEKAHAPTDDEREALTKQFADQIFWAGIRAPDSTKAVIVFKEIAAGFRRTEVPEPNPLLAVIQDAYNAWHMESRSRAIEILHAALSDSEVPEPSADRDEITDEALWDFAGDLLDAWNIEDTNAPSLAEDFRDRFVARFHPAYRPEPQGEPSDDGHLIADCEHGVNSLYDRCAPCEAVEQGEPSDAQEAEIAARALDGLAADFANTEGLGLTSDALCWWSWFAEMLGDKATMLRTEAAALRAAMSLREGGVR